MVAIDDHRRLAETISGRENDKFTRQTTIHLLANDEDGAKWTTGSETPHTPAARAMLATHVRARIPLSLARARSTHRARHRDAVTRASERVESTPSLWESKPPWCQPWTIVSTGVVATAAPTQALHVDGLFGGVATAVIGLGVAVWWFVFLYAVPMAYEADARERVDVFDRERDV